MKTNPISNKPKIHGAKRRNVALHTLLGLFLLPLLALACDSDPAGPEEDLRGGVLVTFQVEGEAFKMWITNPQTIQQVFDLRDGRSNAAIPNGPLLSGPGQGDHNQPWSWHLDPAETEMAEATIELCSALPSFLEADRDEWLNNVGQYCPWSAVLLSVEDFR